MSLVCRPQREDFFPKTRRGHGSMHPSSRFDKDGRKIREATHCVDATCSLNQPKSKNMHHDRGANIKEWEEEHGLRKHDSMHRATGGR